MVLLEPLPEAAGVVKSDSHVGPPLEELQERKVGALVGVLDDGIEIADRLMIVDHDDELEPLHASLPPSERRSLQIPPG